MSLHMGVFGCVCVRGALYSSVWARVCVCVCVCVGVGVFPLISIGLQVLPSWVSSSLLLHPLLSSSFIPSIPPPSFPPHFLPKVHLESIAENEGS